MPASEEGVLALLYAAGGRPSADDVRRAGENSGAFALTFDPGEAPGWPEVLITGLAFELGGLAPGAGVGVPPVAHRIGLEGARQDDNLEAVVLRPGPHLAGAAAMLPVVRGCTALAAALAEHTGAVAVVWIPARSAMGVGHFGAMIADWLNGGAFPALGLTALTPNAAGIASEGMAFFTGQELQVLADTAADRRHLARIAVRLVHLLVQHGPLIAPTALTGPEGESLMAEPVDAGQTVRVRFGD